MVIYDMRVDKEDQSSRGMWLVVMADPIKPRPDFWFLWNFMGDQAIPAGPVVQVFTTSGSLDDAVAEIERKNIPGLLRHHFDYANHHFLGLNHVSIKGYPAMDQSIGTIPSDPGLVFSWTYGGSRILHLRHGRTDQHVDIPLADRTLVILGPDLSRSWTNHTTSDSAPRRIEITIRRTR